MHSSIQLYGLHNESKIMNYVNMNLRQLAFNAGFVELVESVVVKSKEVKPMSKEAVGHLLARVYGVILEVNKGSVVENYRTVRAMCDLILTITSVYTIDFTKHIIKMAEQRSQSEPLYTTFLSSLLMIHHFKLSERTLNKPAFDSTRAIYEQHKYFKNYQNLLEKYGSDDEDELRISELYLNPEKRDGEVPWELLIIRNAVKIDLSNLVQSQCIYPIFCNLMRYVLINVCSEECTEIAMLILDNHSELSSDKMNTLMVSELLQTITRVNHRGNRLPNNQSLKCLHKLVKTMKKVFQLEDIENMSLLIEVTSMVRNIVVLEKPETDS